MQDPPIKQGPSEEEIESLKSQINQAQIEGLQEAARAVCPTCTRGRKPKYASYLRKWAHHTDSGTVQFQCPASNIYDKIKELEEAPNEN